MELDEKARLAVAKAICRAMDDDWEREGPGDVLLEAYGPLADAALSALRPGSETDGWQPIETAPKDGTSILLGHSAASFDGWWDQEAGGWVDGEEDLYGDLRTYEPTHWRPLPSPPAMLAAAGGENG